MQESDELLRRLSEAGGLAAVKRSLARPKDLQDLADLEAIRERLARPL